MRVLHLGKFYPPARGGMETILELVCERTSAAVDNTVLVANDKRSTSKERLRSVEVIRLPTIAKIGAVAICPTLPFRLRTTDTDLIVIHEPNPMALLAYFLARPAGRLIVWFHSEVIRPSWRYALFYRPFLRFAFARAARIIVASPTLAASAPQLLGWQSKCVVIPYGLEIERGDVPESVVTRAQAIRQEAGGRPIVLFVGRLVRYKGVDVLLEAMRGVSAAALLVGNGPERGALERIAEDTAVADRVKFLGEVSQDELAALYRACDLFVLPSVTRQEAFGVVQIEAMACGKPVISTNLGTGSGWVNQDGETGFVVPPRDAAALRGAIQRLLADRMLRERMGAAARHRARTVFGLDSMIASLLALYAEVEGEPAAGRAA
jgi:glycosyltransferase involved in cell wall biosynthesis